MDRKAEEFDEGAVRLALQSLTPVTKAARLRAYLPLIEQKLAAGVRLAEILAVLKANGLDISEATFRSYRQRHRKKAGHSSAATCGASPQPAARTPDQEAPGAPPNPPPFPRGAVPVTAHANVPATPKVGISLDQLERLLHPDPAEEAERMAKYERLGRQLRRGNSV